MPELATPRSNSLPGIVFSPANFARDSGATSIAETIANVPKQIMESYAASKAMAQKEKDDQLKSELVARMEAGGPGAEGLEMTLGPNGPVYTHESTQKIALNKALIAQAQARAETTLIGARQNALENNPKNGTALDRTRAILGLPASSSRIAPGSAASVFVPESDGAMDPLPFSAEDEKADSGLPTQAVETDAGDGLGSMAPGSLPVSGSPTQKDLSLFNVAPTSGMASFDPNGSDYRQVANVAQKAPADGPNLAGFKSDPNVATLETPDITKGQNAVPDGNAGWTVHPSGMVYKEDTSTGALQIKAQDGRILELAEGDKAPRVIHDPQDDVIAQKLANYDISIAELRTLPKEAKSRVLAQAVKINPNFDSKEYLPRRALMQSFKTGPDADRIRSLNAALAHLGKMNELSTGLAQHDNQYWNSAENAINTKWRGQNDVTKFNTAKTSVKEEISRFLKGGVATQSEIEEWEKNFDSSMSPDQLKGSIKTAIELMKEQADAIRNKYETGFKERREKSWLTPNAEKAIKDIGLDPMEINGVTPPEKSQGVQKTAPGVIPVTGAVQAAASILKSPEAMAIKSNPDLSKDQKLAAIRALLSGAKPAKD